MGILKLQSKKPDKKYLIVCLISLILAIICGIVLHICCGISVYSYNFADTYIYYVLNFANARLFFSHLAVDIFYFYVFFLIGYFCKYKYFSCPVLFLKCFFAVIYSIILFSCFSFEGIIVSLVVFLPSFLISSLCCIIICGECKGLKKSIVFFCPAILALLSSVLMLILVNVFFRLLIIIV